MPIIKLQGGLGNQMFQYAFIRAFGLRNKKDFQLDIIEYKTYFRKYGLDVFNIIKKYAQKNDIPWYEQLSSKNKYIFFLILQIRAFSKKLNILHKVERQFNFDKNFLTIDATYIEGFFQSEKYFSDFSEVIRQDFVFRSEPSLKNKDIINIMKSTNSVSLHVRRGDYITNTGASNLLGTCTPEYYAKAIAYIQSKVENPVFFFFSDDISWVKENIQTDTMSYYIDWNTGDHSHEDMRLMSSCKHNIIANSSFSWWGAWLNNNADKIVIAPEKWLQDESVNYQDVVPSTWVKI